MTMSEKPFSLIHPCPVDNDIDAKPKFSRLHVAASNPDWMPAFSHSQAAQARVVLPVDASPAVVTNTSLPEAPPDLLSTSYMGFLSRFCRANNPSGFSSQTHARKAPQPPAALGEVNVDASVPLVQPALPIDATISIEPNKKVLATFPFPIGETSSSLATSGGTWGAFGSVPIPKATKAICNCPVAPLSIDSNCSAPKPLWADLPQAMSSLLGRHGDSAATPSLFRATALRTAEVSTSTSERFKLFPEPNLSREDAEATFTPAPPCPISTSPTRDAEMAAATATSTMGAPSAPQTLLKEPPQPLLPLSPATLPAPIGTEQPVMAGLCSLDEDPSPSLTFLTHKDNDAEAFFPDSAPGFHMFNSLSAPEALGDAANEKLSTAPTSPGVLGFGQSVEEPWITRVASQKRANFRNFLKTLFSSPAVAASDSDLCDDWNATHNLHPEANGATNFDSLEWAIRGSIETPLNFGSSSVTQTLSSTKVTDRNSSLYTSLDKLEDSSEESLEHLRRVVSIVMQTAKQASPPEDDLVQWSSGGSHFNAGTGATSDSVSVSNYTSEGNTAPLFFGA